AHPPSQLRHLLPPGRAPVRWHQPRAAARAHRVPLPVAGDRRGAGAGGHRFRPQGRAQPWPAVQVLPHSQPAAVPRGGDGGAPGAGAWARSAGRAAHRDYPPRLRSCRRIGGLPQRYRAPHRAREGSRGRAARRRLRRHPPLRPLAVERGRQLEALPDGPRRALDGVRRGARPRRAAARDPAGAAGRAYLGALGGGDRHRRGLAVLCGGRLFLPWRGRLARAPLPARHALLPVDDGGRPPGAAVQPGAAAATVGGAPRRGQHLLRARPDRVRTVEAARTHRSNVCL
ncbi:MAG: hypothetical protein AVDCRST_MAG31-1062, partial [uncultured Sphingomonas sp.]